jgi:hypothetical protein
MTCDDLWLLVIAHKPRHARVCELQDGVGVGGVVGWFGPDSMSWVAVGPVSERVRYK